MSVASIARRDFLDVRRAKLVWAPAALYTLFVVLFFWSQSNVQRPDFHQVLWGLTGVGGALVVPLIALVAAYLAVAGERESGAIRFTLGLPVSRGAVLGGKLLARSAVVVAGLAVAFAVGVVAAQAFVPDMAVEYGDYVSFAVLTALYAVTYVAVAVGVSAATSSRSRAMAGALGFFFAFNLVWNFLPVGPTAMLRFVFEEFGVDYSQTLLDFVYTLSPTGAYLNSTGLVIPTTFAGGNVYPAASDPFYVQPWFGVVILASWIAASLGFGYWRFRNADLG